MYTYRLSRVHTGTGHARSGGVPRRGRAAQIGFHRFGAASFKCDSALQFLKYLF